MTERILLTIDTAPAGHGPLGGTVLGPGPRMKYRVNTYRVQLDSVYDGWRERPGIKELIVFRRDSDAPLMRGKHNTVNVWIVDRSVSGEEEYIPFDRGGLRFVST